MFYRTTMTSFRKVEICDLLLTLNVENFMTKCSIFMNKWINYNGNKVQHKSFASHITKVFLSNSNYYVWFYGVLWEITCYYNNMENTSENTHTHTCQNFLFSNNKLIEKIINTLFEGVTHNFVQNWNVTKTNAICQFNFSKVL